MPVPGPVARVRVVLDRVVDRTAVGEDGAGTEFVWGLLAEVGSGG